MLRECPKRVLLIDEQPTLLWGLSSLISAEYPRMEVVGVSFGTRLALDLARSQKPDVILLGTITGIDTLEFIPELAQCGPARILCMDMREDARLHAEAVKRGATAFISKCLPAKKIIDAVARLCALHGDPA